MWWKPFEVSVLSGHCVSCPENQSHVQGGFLQTDTDYGTRFSWK